MNLNFKTHFPWDGPDGKPEPTHFKEQVLNSLYAQVGKPLMYPGQAVKLHTIRRIKHTPRFREGMKLTFSTGSRFKPERFGEAVCTGVQRLNMRVDRQGSCCCLLLRTEDHQRILRLFSERDIEQLANNDGLSFEQFTRWFMLDVLVNGPGRFELVHWTAFRY